MIFNLKLFHFYPAFFFKFNIIVFKIFSYSSFTVIKILQFESGDSCKSGVNEGDGARHSLSWLVTIAEMVGVLPPC